MKDLLEKIFNNSKTAHKKSILADNEELENLLFDIMTDSKKVLDLFDQNSNQAINLSADTRSEEEEIKRLKRKIPSWFSKPNQYNHKILVAYLEASNLNKHAITIDELEKASNLSDQHKFKTNFNQMKIISNKNHGKVFSELNGIITLWDPMAEFIVDEYKKVKGI